MVELGIAVHKTKYCGIQQAHGLILPEGDIVSFPKLLGWLQTLGVEVGVDSRFYISTPVVSTSLSL